MSQYATDLKVEFTTFVELLRWRALNHPDRYVYIFLADGENEEVHLTYEELDRQARAIAGWLQSLGATGERVLLLYPSGLEYISAFFGCLYAGAIAVSVYPPRLNRNLYRLQAIADDAQAKIALTTLPALSRMQPLLETAGLQTLQWLATDSLIYRPGDLADEWREPVNSNMPAFLQYTSGSTAEPKGVMISHGNLLHNNRMIQQAFEQTEESTIVVWLPLFHDMGLVGNVLQSLFLGATCILMSPEAFLLKPFRWLQAISRYKAHTSGGPSFSYDLCARKITPEHRATLDLSSWEVAFNGAEPVRHGTLERFTKTFEPCGFHRKAFYPCYGLAEATLFVSGGLKNALPVVATVDADALESDQVVAAPLRDTDTRTLVGCGRTWLDQKIVIVDPESLTRCRSNRVGEIWISGPNVAHGYWNRQEETDRTFRAYLRDTGEGPFLRTGDLGFFHDGELFITGRLKDLIIIDGRNHYPQDIEQTVEESHPLVRPGCCAAFSVEVTGEERLVIATEVERHCRSMARQQTGEMGEVVGAIRQTVAEHHDLRVHAVLLLQPARLPKTSSGKIQRHACRADFLAGTLNV